MFARIVPRYDLMNHLMTLGQDAAWRRLTVDIAAPDADEPALDLGCGTGDLLLALTGRCRVAVGVDFCEEMLLAAQQKARGRRGLELTLADAHCLPFPDEGFGCIVTGFALRNVADIRQVLAEMHRVVKPGGRIACLELTPAANGPVGRLNSLYQRYFVPSLGRLVVGDAAAYAYLPSSVASFPPAEVLAQMMRAAGWRQVGYRRLGFGAVAIHFGVK